MAYLGNYQTIYVSIETSAKYRCIRLCDAELIHSFSKQNSFIHGVCSVLSYYAVFLSKLVFDSVKNLKGKHVFGKLEIIHVWHSVSSVAQKRNSVDFSNSSC